MLRLILELNGEEILRADPVRVFPLSRFCLLTFTMLSAHWSAAPRNRETHRIQDVHSGSSLLRPLGLRLHEFVDSSYPVSGSS